MSSHPNESDSTVKPAEEEPLPGLAVDSSTVNPSKVDSSAVETEAEPKPREENLQRLKYYQEMEKYIDNIIPPARKRAQSFSVGHENQRQSGLNADFASKDMVRIWNEETGESVIVSSAETTKDALASLCLEPERRHTVANRRRNVDRAPRQQRESVQRNNPTVPKPATAGRSLTTPRRVKQNPKTIGSSKLSIADAQAMFFTYLNFSLYEPEELKRIYDGDLSPLFERMRHDNIPHATLLSFEAMVPVIAPVTDLTTSQSNVTFDSNHTEPEKANDRSHFGISRFIETTPPREGRSPTNFVLANGQRDEESGPSAAPNGSLSFPTDQDGHKMREGANPSRNKDKTTPASVLINAMPPSVRSHNTQKTVACSVNRHSKKGPGFESEKSVRRNSSEVFRKTTDTPDTRCKSNPSEEPVEEDLLAFLRKPLALARAAEQAALEKKLMEAKNKRKPRAKTTVKRSNLSDTNLIETVEQRTAAVPRTEKSRSQSRPSKSSYRSRSVKTHSNVSSHHVENPTLNLSSTGYLPRAGESLRNWIRLDMPLGQALLEVPLGEVAGQLKVQKALSNTMDAVNGAGAEQQMSVRDHLMAVASANRIPAAAGQVFPPYPESSFQLTPGANHQPNEQPSTSDFGAVSQPYITPAVEPSQGLAFEQAVPPTSESTSQPHPEAANVAAAVPQKKPTTNRKRPTKADTEAAGGEPNAEKPKKKRAPPKKKEPAQPSVEQQPMDGTHHDPENVQHINMQAQEQYNPYPQPQYNAHQPESELLRPFYNQPFPASATITRPMNPTPDHQRQEHFGTSAMDNNMMSSYNNGASSSSSSFGHDPFEKKVPERIASMLAPLNGYIEKPLKPLPGTLDEIPPENQEQLGYYQMNQPASSGNYYYPPGYMQNTYASDEIYNGEFDNMTYDQLISHGLVAHSVESHNSSNSRDSTSQSSQHSSLPQTPNPQQMNQTQQMHQSQQFNHSQQFNQCQQGNHLQQFDQAQQVNQYHQVNQSHQINQSEQVNETQQVNQSSQQGPASTKRKKQIRLSEEAIKFNAQEFAQAYGITDKPPDATLPPITLEDIELENLTQDLIGNFFEAFDKDNTGTMSSQATRCSARSEISTPSDCLSNSSVSGPPSNSMQRVSQEEHHNTTMITQHVPQPAQNGFNQQAPQNVPSPKPLTLSDANVQYVSKRPTLLSHSSMNGRHNYTYNGHQQYRQMNDGDSQKDIAHQNPVGRPGDGLQTGGQQVYYVQHVPSETSGTTMHPENGRSSMANPAGLSEEQQSQLLFQQKSRKNRPQRRKMDGEKSPSTGDPGGLSVGEVLRNNMLQKGLLTTNKLDWTQQASTNNVQYKYTFIEKPSQEMPDNILESPEPEKSTQPDADSFTKSKNVKVQQILDKHMESSEQYLVNQFMNDQYTQQENVMQNGGGIVTHHESQRAAPKPADEVQPAAESQPTQKTSLRTMLETPTQEPLYHMPQQQIQHQHHQQIQQYQHTQQHQYHQQQQQGMQQNVVSIGHVHSNMQSVMQQSNQQYSQQAVQHGTQQMAPALPPQNSNPQQKDPIVPVVQAPVTASKKRRVQQPKKKAQNLQVQQQPQIQEPFLQQQQQQTAVQNTSGHYAHQQMQVQPTNGQPMQGQSVQRHPMQQQQGHYQYDSNQPLQNEPVQVPPMQQVQTGPVKNGQVQQYYQASQHHHGHDQSKQQNQYLPGHGQPAQTHSMLTPHVQYQQANEQQIQAPPIQAHQHGQPQQNQTNQVQYQVVYHQPSHAQQIQGQTNQQNSAPQSQMYQVVQSTPAQPTQLQTMPIQQESVEHDSVRAAHIERMQNKGSAAQPLTDEDLDMYDEGASRTTSAQPMPDQQMEPQQVQTHPIPIQRRPSEPLPIQPMQTHPMTITRTLSQPNSVHRALAHPMPTQAMHHQPMPVQTVLKEHNMPIQTTQLVPSRQQSMPSQQPPTEQLPTQPAQDQTMQSQTTPVQPNSAIHSAPVQAMQMPAMSDQATSIQSVPVQPMQNQSMQVHSKLIQKTPNQPLPTDPQFPHQVPDLEAQNAQQVRIQPIQSNQRGQAQRARQQPKPNQKTAQPMLNHYVKVQPLPNTPIPAQFQRMDDQMPVLRAQVPIQQAQSQTSSTHLMSNQKAQILQPQPHSMQNSTPLNQPTQNQQVLNHFVQSLPIQQQPMKSQLSNQTAHIRHEQLPQPSNQEPGSSNQVQPEKKLPSVGENPILAGLFPQNSSSKEKQPRTRKTPAKPKVIQPNQLVNNEGLPLPNTQKQASKERVRKQNPILMSMLSGEDIVTDEQEAANRLLTLYGLRPLAPASELKSKPVTHQNSEESNKSNSQSFQQLEEARPPSIGTQPSKEDGLPESQKSENPTETTSESSDQPKKKKSSKRKDQPKEVVLRGKKLREKMAEDTINQVILESKIPLDNRESCWDRIRLLGIEEDFIEEFDENVAREMIENPSECEIMVDDVMNYPDLEPALHGRFRKRLELVREGGVPVKRKKTIRKSDDEGNSESVGSSNGGLTNQQSSTGQSCSNGTHSAPLSVTTDLDSLNPSSLSMHMTTISSTMVSAEADREIITTLSSHHSTPHTFGINNNMSEKSNMPASSETSLSTHLGTNDIEQDLNTLNRVQQKPSNNNGAQSSSNDMMLSNFSMDDDFLLDNSPTIREDIILQSCRVASPLFFDPRHDFEEPVRPSAEPSLFDDHLKDFESMDSTDCNYMVMNGPCAPEDLFVDQYAIADARCSSSSTVDEIIDNVASSSTVDVVDKSPETTETETARTNGTQKVPEVGAGSEDGKSISSNSSDDQSLRHQRVPSVLTPTELKQIDLLMEQIKVKTKNFGKSRYRPRNSKPIIVNSRPAHLPPVTPVIAPIVAVAGNIQPVVAPIQTEVEAAPLIIENTQTVRINADNVDDLLKGTGYEEDNTGTENNNCKFTAF